MWSNALIPEGESSGVIYCLSMPNKKRIRSDGSSSKAEESNKPRYEGTAEKKMDHKTGCFSTKEVLKTFKMAILP